MNSKSVLLLICIILYGLALRLFQLNSSLYFSGDEGRDLLIIKDIIIKHEIPLLGPPTSLGWFYLGPIVYYLYAPILWIGKFHPLIIAIFNSIVDSLAIYFVLLLGRKVQSIRIGLIAGFLYAASPYAVLLSRLPLHIGLYGLWAALFFYCLFRYFLKRENLYSMLCFLLLGLGVQIHLTVILFGLPFLISIIRNRISKIDLLYGSVVFSTVLLPIFIHEIMNGFTMTTQFLVWIPYRILSFFGFITSKNMISIPKLVQMMDIFTSVISRMLLVSEKNLATILLIGSIIYIYFYMRESKQMKWILLLIGYGLVMLFMHGQPSWHYFGFLMPLIFVLVSTFISWKKIGSVLLFPIIVFNTYTLIGNHYYVNFPFSRQVAIVDAILEETDGKPYEILPPSDIVNLPNYYKNFSYIGWWRGREPVEGEKSIQFIIYPHTRDVSADVVTQKVLVFPEAIVIYSKN